MFFSMNKLFFSLIKENYKGDFFFFIKNLKFVFRKIQNIIFNQSPSLIYFKIRFSIF